MQIATLPENEQSSPSQRDLEANSLRTFYAVFMTFGAVRRVQDLFDKVCLTPSD